MKRYNQIQEKKLRTCALCRYFIKGERECYIVKDVVKFHGIGLVDSWLENPYWENLCRNFEVK